MPDVVYPIILLWIWACFVGLGGRVSVLPFGIFCTMLHYVAIEDDVVIDQLADSRKVEHKLF